MAGKVERRTVACLATIALSIITFFIGGCIYLLYRSETLKMFHWADRLGMRSTILQCRSHVSSDGIPDFVIYALPDGLWLFSYIILIGAVWGFNIRRSIPVMAVLPIIAIGSELLQGIGIMRGTFDIADLTAYMLACLLAIKYIQTLKEYL